MTDKRSPGSASPSVQHVAAVLTEKIRSGSYKSGQWLPSERLLAEEFSVSRIIIREAVKSVESAGLISCSAHCRPLVRNTGSFADVPPTRRRNIALLIWPYRSWPGSSLIVQGIQQALNQDDFRLVLETAMGDTSEEIHTSEARFLERLCRDRDIKGLILWHLGGTQNTNALEAVRAAGVSLVFIDRQPPAGFNADYVGVDNVRSAEEAVRHLLAQGHRRIAHITNLDQASTVVERQRGYEHALKRAGIPLDRALIRRDSGVPQEGDDSSCTLLLRDLRTLADPPTAFFAVNDVVAFQLLTAIRAGGLRVPEDVAVVGFDGIERGEQGTPFLTTVVQPFERIGSQAVELLLKRMEVGITESYRHVLLDAPLVVRDSTSNPNGGGFEFSARVTAHEHGA